MNARYRHPYPSEDAASRFPFVPFEHNRLPERDMYTAAEAFRSTMSLRRSVRMISDRPVPLEIIESAIAAASTAPSGAHRQPWTFVVVGDAAVKREIRQAAEEEERVNYVDGRMNDEWQDAVAPLGTDWHKEFLEIAPWLVVLFEQRFGVEEDGSRCHHYYVKESVGIAAGIFITALHIAGLVTLTHTPTPMAFLTRVLERPDNERPFMLFPVGYPVEGAQVPDLVRKSLDEVRVLIN